MDCCPADYTRKNSECVGNFIGDGTDLEGWATDPDTCSGVCSLPLYSSNKLYNLVVDQNTGNVMLYDSKGTVKGQTRISNISGYKPAPSGYNPVPGVDRGKVIIGPTGGLQIQTYRPTPYKLDMKSDGNLVLYDKDNFVMWNSNTRGKDLTLKIQDVGNAVIKDSNQNILWSLIPYSDTYSDTCTGGLCTFPLVSANKQFSAVMLPEGDVVVYKGYDRSSFVWSTNIENKGAGGPYTLNMQTTDGNLVLYDKNNSWRWQTNTRGVKNTLKLKDDGNLVVVDAVGKLLWSTYNWTNQAPFGVCYSGTRTSTVKCLSSSGNPVDNSLCVGNPPSSSQTCITPRFLSMPPGAFYYIYNYDWSLRFRIYDNKFFLSSTTAPITNVSEAIRSFDTPKTEYNNHIKWLDRQNKLDCEADPLNGFKLQTPAASGLTYKVNCKGIDSRFVVDNSKLDNEKIYETALSETSGGIRFLDKHPIDCGTGKVLSKFAMAGGTGDDRMNFQYKCKNVLEPIECRDVFTDWAGPCTALECLDRQELKCNSDESISGFQLQGKFNDFNRYKYTCCKVISSYKFKVVSNNRVSELPYEIQNEKGETLNFFVVPSTLAVRITLGDSQTTNKITSATLTMDGRILLYDPAADLFYSVYDDEGSLWATSNSKAVSNTGVWKFQDQPGTNMGLTLWNKDIFPKYPMTPADYVEIFKDKSKTQVFNCAPGDVGGSDGNCGSCPRSQHNTGSVSWSPIFQQAAYDRTCPAQTKKIYGFNERRSSGTTSFLNWDLYCEKSADESEITPERRQACASLDPSVLDSEGKLDFCKCNFETSPITIDGTQIENENTKNVVYAPWSADTKSSEIYKTFCSQHDSSKGGPMFSTDKRCNAWCTSPGNEANCTAAKDAYCKLFPLHQECSMACSNNSMNCFKTYDTMCVGEALNTEQCQTWCKQKGVDCDSRLKGYCKDIRGQKLDNSNICGCFLPDDFYKNYFESLTKKIAIPPNMKEVPPSCYFTSCSTQDLKPYNEKQDGLKCPNVQSCIQDVEYTNTGTVTNEPTLTQNSECNFCPVNQIWSDTEKRCLAYFWKPDEWSRCSKEGKQTREFTCMDDSDNPVDSKLCTAKKPEDNNKSCSSYRWTGVWGDCDPTTLKQSRTNVCLDNTDKPADKDKCIQPPSTSRDCSQTVAKNTKENSEGLNELAYFDRHNLDCGLKPINEFRLKPLPNEIQFDYLCGGIGAEFLKTPKVSKNTLDVSRWPSSTALSGMESVDCGDGAVLSQVKYDVKDFGNNKGKYNYACLAVDPKPTKCEKRNTSFKTMSPSLHSLDQFDLRCNVNEALSQFQFKKNPANDKEFGYEFTCCQSPPKSNHWDESGEWGSCVNGIESRPISKCLNEFDKVQDDKLCPGKQPENSRACKTHWDFLDDGWSDCNSINNKQTNQPVCVSDTTNKELVNSMCAFIAPPPQTRDCTSSSSVYKWDLGEWGECGKNSVQNRAYVRCLDPTGQTVSNSLCDPLKEHKTSRKCTPANTYSWKPEADWSSCDQGKRSKTFECLDQNNSKSLDTRCSLTKPTDLSEDCTIEKKSYVLYYIIGVILLLGVIGGGVYFYKKK